MPLYVVILPRDWRAGRELKQEFVEFASMPARGHKSIFHVNRMLNRAGFTADLLVFGLPGLLLVGKLAGFGCSHSDRHLY